MVPATRRLACGAAAGFAATVPMTLFMEFLHHTLPRERRGALPAPPVTQRGGEPLPPHRITKRAVKKAGVDQELTEPQKQNLTLVSHFGYGTGMGAAYGLLAPNVPEPVLGGIAFGLAVWAGSYLGWLPAAGLPPPATEDRAERNALMIGAHILWGGVLGALTARLHPGRENPD